MKLPVLRRRSVVQSPNHFQNDFGRLAPAKQEKVIAVLRVFMEAVRRIHETESVESTKSPSPKGFCVSCALAPATDDWKGFPGTAYGFLRSVCRGSTFLCHANQPKWQENLIDSTCGLIPCRGLTRLREVHREKTEQAAAEAMAKITRIFPKFKLPAWVERQTGQR